MLVHKPVRHNIGNQCPQFLWVKINMTIEISAAPDIEQLHRLASLLYMHGDGQLYVPDWIVVLTSKVLMNA